MFKPIDLVIAAFGLALVAFVGAHLWAAAEPGFSQVTKALTGYQVDRR